MSTWCFTALGNKLERLFISFHFKKGPKYSGPREDRAVGGQSFLRELKL